jgi:hypothetical protein
MGVSGESCFETGVLVLDFANKAPKILPPLTAFSLLWSMKGAELGSVIVVRSEIGSGIKEEGKNFFVWMGGGFITPDVPDVPDVGEVEGLI